MKVWDLLFRSRTLAILVGLVLATGTLSRQFTSTLNLQHLLFQFSVDGIMSVGMTLVMIGGAFDLSIGSTMALAGVAAILLQPLGIWTAVTLALLLGILVGLANGGLITKVGINPFIATLGTMITVRGLVVGYTEAYPVPNESEVFARLGTSTVGGIPIPALFFSATLAVAHVLLTKTRLGRHIYALGGHEEAARLSGVPTDRMRLFTFTVSGFTAALGGVILAARLNTGSPIIGEDAPLVAITAVLLGGTSLTGGSGSVMGTLVGVLIIGVLANGLNLLAVPAYYQTVVKGGLLLGAVAFDAWYLRRLSGAPARLKRRPMTGWP